MRLLVFTERWRHGTAHLRLTNQAVQSPSSSTSPRLSLALSTPQTLSLSLILCLSFSFPHNFFPYSFLSSPLKPSLPFLAFPPSFLSFSTNPTVPSLTVLHFLPLHSLPITLHNPSPQSRAPFTRIKAFPCQLGDCCCIPLSPALHPRPPPLYGFSAPLLGRNYRILFYYVLKIHLSTTLPPSMQKNEKKTICLQYSARISSVTINDLLVTDLCWSCGDAALPSPHPQIKQQPSNAHRNNLLKKSKEISNTAFFFFPFLSFSISSFLPYSLLPFSALLSPLLCPVSPASLLFLPSFPPPLSVPVVDLLMVMC